MATPTTNDADNLLWIPFERPLEMAVFIERPNRFIAVIQHPDHPQPVRAHVADPGRLKELMIPGTSLLVTDHGDNPNRKLRYTVALVRSQDNHWVSINSQLPNRLIRTMLTNGNLPGYEGYQLVRPEFTYQSPTGKKSRFDFLLETPDGVPCLLEVKGASLVEEGWCKFPDAPTVRGARHVRELTTALNDGYEARVIFVVQRDDAHTMTPHYQRDPDFNKAVVAAMAAGVCVQAFRFGMSEQGCRFAGEIPVEISGQPDG